jgi:hypothetical protein
MKKLISFLKKLKDKVYIKLIEILVESESRKMPKKLEEDFRELKEQFSFFNDLSQIQKVCMILLGIIIFIVVIYWHFAVITMIFRLF